MTQNEIDSIIGAFNSANALTGLTFDSLLISVGFELGAVTDDMFHNSSFDEVLAACRNDHIVFHQALDEAEASLRQERNA